MSESPFAKRETDIPEYGGKCPKCGATGKQICCLSFTDTNPYKQLASEMAECLGKIVNDVYEGIEPPTGTAMDLLKKYKAVLDERGRYE